jgi:predicted transglutaminase-like cysteine proteinase
MISAFRVGALVLVASIIGLYSFFMPRPETESHGPEAEPYETLGNVAEVTSTQNKDVFWKWVSVQRRYEHEKTLSPETCSDNACGRLIKAKAMWDENLALMKDMDLPKKMEAVNNLINQIRYMPDSRLYGKSDYWATPFEMVEKWGGDCEDFSIAKYYALKQLGVDPSSMRMAMVQDLNLGGIVHEVLLVRVGKKQFMLDNQVKKVTSVQDIMHYRPIYGINEQDWVLYRPRVKQEDI